MIEKEYLKLLKELVNTPAHDDRTGVGRRSVYGRQLSADINNTIPLLTTKKVFVRGVIEELLWFISGSTNVKDLQSKGVNIWNEWADDKGEIGPLYGRMWRDWDGIDQLGTLINNLQSKPHSSRHIVSAWNPALLPDESTEPHVNASRGLQALAPCHCMFQCFVNNKKLTMSLYQRSADVFLGVPFNLASYAILTHLLAEVCSLEPDRLIVTFGDLHLYDNHVEQAKCQIAREHLIKKSPEIAINPFINDIQEFEFGDISIFNYKPLDSIKAPIAV